LRSATARLHEEIDAQFSGFDLAEGAGLAAFLSAQAIALRECQPRVDRFGREVLGCAPIDYAQIAASDLANLGVDAALLPQVWLPREIADAGVFYVVAGSRMGAAVLRQRATALTPTGVAQDVCGFFAIGEGPGQFRLFRQWLAQRPAEAVAAISYAATATFHLFAQAAKLAAQDAAGMPDTHTGDDACA
jgi:heme oxygenase